MTEGAPVVEGLPEEANSIGDPRRTTETEARSLVVTVYACTVSWRSLPGKIRISTNQIRAISMRARVSRE